MPKIVCKYTNWFTDIDFVVVFQLPLQNPFRMIKLLICILLTCLIFVQKVLQPYFPKLFDINCIINIKLNNPSYTHVKDIFKIVYKQTQLVLQLWLE